MLHKHLYNLINAGVTQLTRASAFQAESCGFEFRLPLNNIWLYYNKIAEIEWYGKESRTSCDGSKGFTSKEKESDSKCLINLGCVM